MLRPVLAALLAVALLGVAFPAVDTAAVERSGRLADGELAAVETAVRDLVDREVPMADPAEAARRTVTVDVPGDTFTTAPVAFVSLGGVPDRSPTAGDPGRPTNATEAPDRSTNATDARVLAYRLGGTTHRRRLPVPVRILGPDGDLEPPGEPLVVRGRTRVTLLLLQRNGEPVVAVRTAGAGAGAHDTTDGDPDAR